MVNKVIQAVAGAGKTYKITHELDSNKRYLFLTFTNGNVRNLENGLLESMANPTNYYVSTFSKFLIDWVINPFKPMLLPSKVREYKGFTNFQPVNDARLPRYYTHDNAYHYIDKSKSLFLSRISELVMYQKKKSKEFLTLVFNRMSKYIDEIVIDEFQDLTGNDFKILSLLMKQKEVKITLVGDVYQSNVSKSDQRKPAPYIGNWEEITQVLYKNFGKRIEINTASLRNSRRIGEGVANFIETHLDIVIKSDGRHTGGTNLIKTRTDAISVLNMNPTILIWNKKINVPIQYKSCTWGYSKGDTLELVLIILTSSTEKFLFSDSKNEKLSVEIRNKLYVAMSRSQGDVYFISPTLWKEVLTYL